MKAHSAASIINDLFVMAHSEQIIDAAIRQSISNYFLLIVSSNRGRITYYSANKRIHSLL